VEPVEVRFRALELALSRDEFARYPTAYAEIFAAWAVEDDDALAAASAELVDLMEPVAEEPRPEPAPEPALPSDFNGFGSRAPRPRTFRG
jgi:hypothetical protein